MTGDFLQIAIFCAILVVLTPLLGGYMARVFMGQPVFLTPLLAPVERVLYKAANVKPEEGQHWTRYALAVLVFNFCGFLLLYAILRLQHGLPLNPEKLEGVPPALAFNTAISFMTNTNWQAYGGESTLSYFSQMAGLTVQNFLSAGTGIAVMVAVIRGFAGRQIKTLGNFYADLTRACLYVLLPLSLIGAVFLISQGVPQNLNAYVPAQTLEGAQQVLPQGPVASQVAIKQIGTNGGGFFNANSSHPYENPTPLSNLFEMICILLIPAAQFYMFGRMVGDIRQIWTLYGPMSIMLVGLAVVYCVEMAGNPLLDTLPIDQSAGYMEGKEVRFGVVNSALWATATTAAANGSVNAMHDSLTPLGGMVTMLNIQLGEIIYGGAGAGLYGLLLFVVLSVFIAGLMVGRTPEYLGKKIEAREVKFAMLALLTVSFGALGGTAAAVVIPWSHVSVQDPGPHGLSEVLYAYSSATGNNGSSFAGFNASTAYQTTALGLCMFLGRFASIVPMLAIAGSLGLKKIVPASAGTLPTHTPLFITLLIAVILIVGGLTFFPALALGPLAEFFAIQNGQTF
jgi:K+-transporting ATPase ATPase A chain